MQIMKSITILASCVFMASCTQMLEVSQNLRKSLDSISPTSSTASTAISSATPNQICKDFDDNSVRAKAYYGKRITFKAKALSISDAGYAGITFKSGNAHIIFIMKSLSEAAKINKGTTYTATGEIRDIGLSVSDLSSKCSITIMGDSIK